MRFPEGEPPLFRTCAIKWVPGPGRIHVSSIVQEGHPRALFFFFRVQDREILLEA